MPATARSLPGIRFETQAPPVADVLPRMDVAAFVGFAGSGPLDVPVPLEDAAQFADVFGADAPLATDDARGEPVSAQLGPAVRAFFRNGGRRCWVVRVAGDSAVADRFAVPGLLSVGADGFVDAAVLAARSPGSWADGLAVSAVVSAAPVRVQPTADPRRFAGLVAEPGELAPGDLVRIAFAGPTLVFTVGDVEAAPGGAVHAGGVALQPVTLRADVLRWLTPVTAWPVPDGLLGFLAADGESLLLPATVTAAGAGGVELSVAVRPEVAPPPGTVALGEFGTRTVWLSIGEAAAAPDGRTALSAAAWEVTATVSSVPPAPAVAERLTLGLRVEAGTAASWTLDGLGFGAAHPRFAGALPDDATIYGTAAPAPGTLAAEAAAPRFPLAGPLQPAAAFLPLAVPVTGGPARPAMPPPGSARVRDGLHDLDLTRFLDPDLAATTPALLREQATWITAAAPAPRALRGAHALLDVDEVTILAAPDAVQRPWVEAGAAEPPAPEPPVPLPPRDRSAFADCALRVPAAPALSLVPGAGSSFTLEWTATDVAGAQYELQEASDPAWEDAAPLYAGPERELTIQERPPGATLYYRVRATAAGQASAWSNGVTFTRAGEPRWVLDAPAAYRDEALVALQLALLRLCAARGDLVAVLGLPEHYRERDAIAHVQALHAAVGDPARREPDPLFSFGALYHPWLYTAESATGAPPLRTPPHGAAAGVMAERAARRGAWVAPANEPLRDVVALDPPPAPAAYGALQASQVNVVRPQPDGFLCLAADTLAETDDLRPLGTRRTLAVLRRAALLTGQAFVFEPNGDVLRRAVRRRFEALLARMYALGAFAGATAAEAFQVVIGPAAPAETDAGLLVVELRVAPAHPLEFLVVRLVRSGAGALTLEGR